MLEINNWGIQCTQMVMRADRVSGCRSSMAEHWQLKAWSCEFDPQQCACHFFDFSVIINLFIHHVRFYHRTAALFPKSLCT